MNSQITITINIGLIARCAKRLKDWNEDRKYKFCSCKGPTNLCCSRELKKNGIEPTPYLHCQNCLMPNKPYYKGWIVDKNY